MINEQGYNEQGQIVDWDKFDSFMKEKLDKENQKWLQEAILYDPAGSICGWCGGINNFADDCGWFILTPYGDDERVCCENCYRGPLGKMHIKRYGIGER